MHLKRNGILSGKLVLTVFLVFSLSTLVAASGCGSGAAPRGWSGVAVGESALYLGTMEGKLVALNPADGVQRWSAILERPDPGGFFSPPKTVAIYGTPVVKGDSVYIGSYILGGGNESGRVFAFPAEGNEPRWIYPAQGYLDGAFVGSPVVSQGKVYLGCTNGKVYALDAGSGEWKWDFQTGGQIWATPAVNDDTLFVGSFDNKLYALDAASGYEKWHFKAGGAIIAAPLIYNNTVYVGSYNRKFYALDTGTGKVKWQFTASKGFWANPIATGDAVYVPCLDGKVYIWDAATGRDLGTLSLGKLISSSPVLVDGSVMVVSQGGRLYTIVSGVNREVELKDLAVTVNAPLSAANGNIYIHSEKPEKLFALTAKGAELWPSLSLKGK